MPIWFGTGTGETALRRAARLGDGWMTIGDFLPHIARFQGYLSEFGRDPVGFPIRGSMIAGDGGPDSWIGTAFRYRDAGVTHLNIGAPAGVPALERVVAARAAIAGALG